MPESLDLTATPETNVGVQDTGELAAALMNRQIRARLQIVEAFQRLGIPHALWPDFVRTFFANPQARTLFRELIEPPPFHVPIFDRLKQSPLEWKRAVDADWRRWQKRCTNFLEKCQTYATLAEDEEIPPTRSTRGAGQKGRRLNAPALRRYEWAARRLSGAGWKEIAGASFTTAQVAKGAGQVLELAGWPPAMEPAFKTPEVEGAI